MQVISNTLWEAGEKFAGVDELHTFCVYLRQWCKISAVQH